MTPEEAREQLNRATTERAARFTERYGARYAARLAEEQAAKEVADERARGFWEIVRLKCELAYTIQRGDFPRAD